MKNPIVHLSAIELNHSIRKKEFSLTEIAEAFLNQHENYEPKVRSWVYFNEQKWFDDIKRLESRNDYSDLVLYGIPFGVKDIYFTKDMPTKMGSKLFFDFFSDYDATSLDEITKSGGILMGKTVTTEFAMNDPTDVINPWNEEYSAGGSSTGSAVAVSMRMCPIALGTQTAGSVLRPASYNGIIGFKPSLGKISTKGIFPVSSTLDTVGWMARTIEDIAIVLDVLSSEKQTGNNDFSGNIQTNCLEEVSNFEQERPKIGMIGAFFERESSLEIQANMFEIIEKLSNYGAKIEIFKLPNSFIGINEARTIIEYSEAYTFHKNFFGNLIDCYSLNARNRLKSGDYIKARDYIRSLKLLFQFREEMKNSLKNFDVLIVPCNPEGVPKDRETTGDPKFQSPWTAAGLPAISIPSGIDNNGMPIGIQIVGNYLEDNKLLKVANWIKNVINIDIGLPTIFNDEIEKK